MFGNRLRGLGRGALYAAVVLLSGSGWVGCKRNRAAPSPEASASAAASASARTTAFDPTPRLEMLDAGQAPRGLLKVELEPGIRQQVRVRSSSKASQVVEGKKQDVSPAASQTTLDATVSTVDSIGAFVVIGLDRAGLAASDPKVIDAVEKSVMRVLVTPNGEIKLAGAKGPAVQEARALHVLQQAASNLVANAIPLPTEPVGVGARWRVIVHHRGALSVERRAEVELVEKSERAVKLRISGKLAAAPQPIRVPGAQMRLERFEGTLKGERIVPLDRPLFVGSVTADSKQHAIATKGGQQEKVVTHTVAIRSYEELDVIGGLEPKSSPSAAPSAGPEN